MRMFMVLSWGMGTLCGRRMLGLSSAYYCYLCQRCLRVCQKDYFLLFSFFYLSYNRLFLDFLSCTLFSSI